MLSLYRNRTFRSDLVLRSTQDAAVYGLFIFYVRPGIWSIPVISPSAILSFVFSRLS